MAIHAYRQSLDSTSGEVGIERRRYCADATLEVEQTFIDVLIIGNDCTPKYIRVSTEILGGRMQDIICAQRQRTLQVRGSKSVVYNNLRVLLDSHNAFDVRDCQRRVGRCLEPDHLGVGLNSGRNRIKICS